MRNPKRIKPMLKSLESLWKEYPDLRLGQLIEICRGMSGSYADIFNIEDDVMLIGIKEYHSHAKQQKNQ